MRYTAFPDFYVLRNTGYKQYPTFKKEMRSHNALNHPAIIEYLRFDFRLIYFLIMLFGYLVYYSIVLYFLVYT